MTLLMISYSPLNKTVNKYSNVLRKIIKLKIFIDILRAVVEVITIVQLQKSHFSVPTAVSFNSDQMKLYFQNLR